MVLQLLPLENPMSAEHNSQGKRVLNNDAAQRSSKKAKSSAGISNASRSASPKFTEESDLTREPTPEIVAETINVAVEKENMETSFWKTKYEELAAAAQTDAATNFELLQEQTKDRMAAMKNTIAFLEEKIGMRHSEIATKEEVNMVKRQAAKKDKLLKFYQKLTSTNVVYNKETKSYECLIMNPENNKGVKFDVTRTKESDNKFQAKANAKYLPEFLRSTAVFDDSQFPFLLKEIYNTDMFKEEEE
ncbi:hypothetical protein TrST_g11964 [Triparma strigata]|uniref:Uncharacterized protein n=1 Tax=Triparma strigata TaxID=1606541 RepID=A0A9W7B448_9STRA|nr:hypothetical protein TrST_g11964 [Triparma strigata]